MSVYLGDKGRIELARVESGNFLRSELSPSDVNVSRRRFSVNFTLGALVTGDLITIATEDKSTLELVKGHVFPDWTGFVHVDEIGGLRLYRTFSQAVCDETSNALELVEPSTTKNITIETQTDRFRCLAQVTSFDMTTSRDLVEVTTLCNEFKHQYEAGLISGQGKMSCFWEHQYCRDDCCDLSGASATIEFSVYLARLVLRLQQGAKFRGHFFIYAGDKAAVWYACDCIVSNVQVSVTPDELITTEIDFVTTGPVLLRQKSDISYILQEDGLSKILLEGNQDGALLQEAE